MLDDLGVDGDHFDEPMGEFAERFGVDMSGYRRYLIVIGNCAAPCPNWPLLRYDESSMDEEKTALSDHCRTKNEGCWKRSSTIVSSMDGTNRAQLESTTAHLILEH